MKESAEIINLPKSHGGLTPSRSPVVLCDACGQDTLLPFSRAWHELKKGSDVAKRSDPPVVLIKWYDFTKWLLDRVDSWVQLVTRCVVGGYVSPERHFMGSSTNEVRRSVSANGVMSRKWRVWTAIEPEGLADSSLGHRPRNQTIHDQMP